MPTVPLHIVVSTAFAVLFAVTAPASAAPPGRAATATAPEKDLFPLLRDRAWRLVDARDRSGRRIDALLDDTKPAPQLDIEGPLRPLAPAMRAMLEADLRSTDVMRKYPVAPYESGNAQWSLTNMCNTLTGEAIVVGHHILLLHDPHTLDSCPRGWENRDSSLHGILRSFRITVTRGLSQRLVLSGSDGQSLEFVAAP